MRTSPVRLAGLDPADALAAITVNARALGGTTINPRADRERETVELFTYGEPIAEFTPTVVVPAEFRHRLSSTVYDGRPRRRGLRRLLSRH